MVCFDLGGNKKLSVDVGSGEILIGSRFAKISVRGSLSCTFLLSEKSRSLRSGRGAPFISKSSLPKELNEAMSKNGGGGGDDGGVDFTFVIAFFDGVLRGVSLDVVVHRIDLHSSGLPFWNNLWKNAPQFGPPLSRRNPQRFSFRTKLSYFTKGKKFGKILEANANGLRTINPWPFGSHFIISCASGYAKTSIKISGKFFRVVTVSIV